MEVLEGMGDAGQLIALFAAWKVVEEFLRFTGVRRSKKTNGVEKNCLNEQEHDWLKELSQMHAVKDSNGIPKWYFPDEVTDSIKESSKHSEKNMNNIERMLRAEEKMLEGIREMTFSIGALRKDIAKFLE